HRPLDAVVGNDCDAVPLLDPEEDQPRARSIDLVLEFTKVKPLPGAVRLLRSKQLLVGEILRRIFQKFRQSMKGSRHRWAEDRKPRSEGQRRSRDLLLRARFRAPRGLEPARTDPCLPSASSLLVAK